ncbi:lipopolysaccharide-induced tumor necrosis factor-alpha factor-like protein [Dinothrombium tinctorium]|uniref:Lipopolysaccharide-induced tumor necrosis factor-alpha factor-like protein n=1 Tax=Dinothrombium tinctorium TaxID=1965070 RepID=A0A3S3PAE4_9ACAR|nr:lipopolysaccharide-induced tumor necrosis factor-alpha factor-like protein [Dinothrombium tinctorium]RWS08831.1 lipopolysaccharide-induced tumor necrosis factor-alpha factor-like protein [Dinothrombium tinctorium]RWS08885.1 lipopolysaccharide-induced tumor necrosis factor-alpha factor-like protein [Dinothrombium tinctorium]
MICTHCGESVMTKIRTTSGLLTWFMCIVICLIGCFWGCCLIPFCMKMFKDVEHRCPKCKAFLGIYKKIQ